MLKKIKEDLQKIAIDFNHKNSRDVNLSFEVEIPKDKSHGDVATNLAMITGKAYKINPREIAKDIQKEIKSNLLYVERVEIAGPGFLNMYLKTDFIQHLLIDIIIEQEDYGYPNIGNDELINIEYASPNPTGPVHIGHARGAVYGDVLANLLKRCGYNVTKEYYINDAGNQINVLAQSVYFRYLEAIGKGGQEIPQGMYPGEYLIEIGMELAKEYGDKLEKMKEKIEIIKDFALEKMMIEIKSDLEKAGIEHDVFTSEKKLSNQIPNVFDILEKKGLTYYGTLANPKGKSKESYQEREQLLFRSKDFADDEDRSLTREDGLPSYFAMDVVYHKNKLDRGFMKMILVLGADHGGYIKRLTAAVAALSDNKAQIEIKICQLVNFVKDGKPVKMSKRDGTFLTMSEVIDEVGVDILRFIMLTRRNDAMFDFDYNLVKSQSKDNPVFYVQYAHTRCCSVLRNAEQLNINIQELVSDKNDMLEVLKLLNHEKELEIIKKLIIFENVVESATLKYEPHLLAFYIIELVSQFHSLWNFANDENQLKFIIENNLELTKARLLLVFAIKTIISSVLNTFGIKALERM